MENNKIIFKNGTLIALGIIIFFFVMKFIGLDSNSWLRMLNFIFVGIGINNAIKENILKNGSTVYTINLMVGLFTSLVGIMITIIGLIVYVEVINPSFIEVLQKSYLFAGNVTLGSVAVGLIIEGVASSIVSSFVIMQYYKNYKLLVTT